MTNLSGFRDYNTDDGEPYWAVTIRHALNAIIGEMDSWGNARVLNPTTGEIFEGPLSNLVSRIAEAITSGHDVRVEPVMKTPARHIVRVVGFNISREMVEITQDGSYPGIDPDLHRKHIPGVATITLVLEDGNVIKWDKPTMREDHLPEYVEMISPGVWSSIDPLDIPEPT